MMFVYVFSCQYSQNKNEILLNKKQNILNKKIMMILKDSLPEKLHSGIKPLHHLSPL